MLIIVDGPDCSAKSTLVDRLAAELTKTAPVDDSVLLKHAGPPLSHPLDEYELALGDYRPGTGQHVVCDRWHWGETVYPAVLGRPTKLTSAAWLHIDMFLQSRGAIVVSAISTTKRIQRCIKERGDDLVTAGMIPRLQDGFTDCRDRSLVPVVAVDAYAAQNDLISDIVRRADWLEQRTMRLNPFTTYVGSWAPELLLFGDVRHGWTGDITDLRTAFMPYSATSGQFMLNALSKWGSHTQLAKLGIANANDADDHKQLWRALGKPTTVTLGVNAKRTVKFAHRHVPHPQYVRRFQHGSGSAYAKLILTGHVELDDVNLGGDPVGTQA